MSLGGLRFKTAGGTSHAAAFIHRRLKKGEYEEYLMTFILIYACSAAPTQMQLIVDVSRI